MIHEPIQALVTGNSLTVQECAFEIPSRSR